MKLTIRFFCEAWLLVIILSFCSPVFAQSGGRDYSRLIERYTNSDLASLEGNTLYQLAAAYEETMSYPQALAAYRVCYERNPDEISLLNDLARVCTKSGLTREAIGYLEKAVAQREEDHYLRYKLAEANYNAGEYGGAAELCVDLLDRDYNHPHVWLLMGQSCQAMGLADAALSQYWEACRQQPHNRASALKYLNLFLTFRETDPIVNQEAISVCDSVLIYNPSDPDIRFAKAILHYRITDFKGADDIFSEMLIEGDSLPSVVRYDGMARVHINRNMDAIPLLTLAYQRDTTDYLVLMALANANLSLSRHTEAETFLNKAEETLKLEERHFSIETTRGNLYYKANRWKESVLHYYNAYQLYNNSDLTVLASAYSVSIKEQPVLNEKSLFLLYTLVNRALELRHPLPNKRYYLAELEKYLEGAFFGGSETLPMRSPTGRTATVTMEKLKEMIDRLQ